MPSSTTSEQLRSRICFKRCRWISQATARTPHSMACAVLLPGAAHRSRKVWPGWRSRNGTMDCAPMSWMRPVLAMCVSAGCKERGGDPGRPFCLPNWLIPAFQQPGGHGEIGGAVRPGHGLPVGLSQDRVDQSRGRRFVNALHQLHAFADGGMRRNAIQIAELINAHAQSDLTSGSGGRGTRRAIR